MGEEARDSVAWGLEAYEERFEALAGFSFAAAVERARPYLRPAEDYVPQAVEQLRGIAEGAGVSFDRLFTLNCSEEFTCAADVAWPPEHCTSFAVAAGGRVVSGHNEDWYPEEIEAQAVRIVRLTGRGGGASYISAGPAYNLPITGVTAAGFTSAANTVYYRDERVGVPNNFLLAAVLAQPDLERARDLITRAPRARGSNHLLCDARGTGLGHRDERRAVGVPGRLAALRRRGRRRRRRALHAHQPLSCRRSSRRATPRSPRARACGAPAPRSCSSRGSRTAPTSSSWASPCSATTPTRPSASVTTGKTTTPTRTRA